MAARAPVQRSLAAGIGSLTRWSRVPDADDRRAALAPANRGRKAQFLRQAIDEAAARGVELTDAEADTAADALQRAHYKRMALASVAARRASVRRRKS